MDRRQLTLLAIALLVGLAIGIVDSSPGWDSTGITAGSLGLAAAAVAFIGRDRPWLWASAVGAPTVVLGIAAGADATIAFAMVFAVAGAVIGRAIRRSMAAGPSRPGCASAQRPRRVPLQKAQRLGQVGPAEPEPEVVAGVTEHGTRHQ
jgi:hypothetical protein